MEVDFAKIEKLIELGASAREVLKLWKAHEHEKNRTPRDKLFTEGLLTLINMTGKAPASCRSFIGKCLKAANDDAGVVLAAIEDAERRQVADAAAWIAGTLKNRDKSTVVDPRALDWDAILKTYKKIGYWSRWAGPDPESPACRAPRELLIKHGIAA